MIDKVDLNNYYNNYKAGAVKRVEDEQDIFSLGEKEPGVIYEPSGKAKEAKEKTQSQPEKLEAKKPEESVILDLSQSAEGKETPSADSDFKEGIKKLFGKALQFFKSVFSTLWNGEAAAPKEAATEVTEPRDEEAVVRELLKSKDKEKLAAYLTNNGEKQAARNSDLLTCYNKKGQIVSVDPSDKRKILEGTYHEIKL